MRHKPHICEKCEKICEAIEIDEGNYEEFWGAPVWRPVWEVRSACCNADAYTVDEWQESGWGEPKNLNYYELVEHGFLDEE